MADAVEVRPFQAKALLARVRALGVHTARNEAVHLVREKEVDDVEAEVLSLVTALSSYDASYLWLAGVLGADLVTLDLRLAAATEDAAHA